MRYYVWFSQIRSHIICLEHSEIVNRIMLRIIKITSALTSETKTEFGYRLFTKNVAIE